MILLVAVMPLKSFFRIESTHGCDCDKRNRGLTFCLSRDVKPHSSLLQELIQLQLLYKLC
jgi:hypothetical protein